MPFQDSIKRYATGPQLLRQATAGMSREQLVARPIPVRWSTLEVVCHLADFEVVSVDRMTAVIAETDPTLPGRDERQYAARLAYDDRDLEEQLRLIELCRSHVTRILHTLNDQDWQRRGMHTEAGPLTLEQLVQRFVWHIENHLQFIHTKREALGI